MDQVKNDNRYAYIKVHKDFCHTYESKTDTSKTSYTFVLPKGTVVGDQDLSYGKIYPKFVGPDHFNPNMMLAKYDKEHLQDENNAINVMKFVDGENKFFKVDVDVLSNAVAKANYNYLKENEISNEIEEELDI